MLNAKLILVFAQTCLKFLSKSSDAALSLFAFYVALLFCDVDALEGVLIVAVLFVQTISGMLIYHRVSMNRLSFSAEFLGMGFAIGSFLSMVGDQLLLHSRFSAVGWLLPLGLGLFLNFPEVIERVLVILYIGDSATENEKFFAFAPNRLADSGLEHNH